MLPQIINYFSYLLTGLIFGTVFVMLYTRLTPYDELRLIREGITAAAYSFGGALLGFVLTIASSIFHSNDLYSFAMWSALAMVVQLLVFAIATRLIPELDVAIREDNKAVGLLLGSVALTIGVINAACLS